MLKRHNRLMVVLFAGADVLLTWLALVLAYTLRFNTTAFREWFPLIHGEPPLEHFANPVYLAVIAIVWVTTFYFNGLYQPRRGKSFIDEVFILLTSVSLALMIVLGVAFFYRQGEFSRVVMLLFAMLDFLFLAVSRLAVRTLLSYLRKQGYNQRQVLIAGAGKLGQVMLERLKQHRSLGYEVVGFVDDDPRLQGKKVYGVPVLGTLDEIREVLSRRSFDYLFMALPIDNYSRMCEVMVMLEDELVTIKFVPDIMQYITFRAGVEELDGIPIINLNHIPMTGWPMMVKRVLDVLGASLLILLLSPLLLVLAFLVKISSKGPVIFRQTRLGLDGKRFTMYKFRTMRDSEPEERQWTTKNDQRVTPIGRFMRRWSLDELPQLFNVLKGTMSLVGPRPEQPNFVTEFRGKIPRYMLRHKAKSGITGWAQVHGLRGDTSIEKRLQFDLYYIDNWSLSLDIKILLLTLFRVRLNAY